MTWLDVEEDEVIDSRICKATREAIYFDFYSALDDLKFNRAIGLETEYTEEIDEEQGTGTITIKGVQNG